MATKRFQIDRYAVKLGDALTATWSGVQIRARGIVACYGEGHRFIAYFLTEDSEVPPPVYVEENSVGAIFRPFEEMQAYVDLVRNEKPLYAYLNSTSPQWNNISSSLEPVGEEEEDS